MKPRRMSVQFHDEARPIGSGWRLVDVREGRKWVHVKEYATGRYKRFTRKKWAEISTNAKEVA